MGSNKGNGKDKTCTKLYPGEFDCYGKALWDEPIFVLLGRDPFAPALVRRWANWAVLNGKDPEQVACAFAIADQMDRFREKGPEHWHNQQQPRKRFRRTGTRG